MISSEGLNLASFLVIILILPSESKPEIGDYIVDCSACNFLPCKKVDSYRCNVICDADGEASVNLTSLYDIVRKLSAELEETKNGLMVAEERLKIDVSFYADLGGDVSVNPGDKIIFKDVISNIGNAYDDATGIFTAPYKGTYTFTLFSVATNSSEHRSLLKVNGVTQARGYGRSGWATGGCTLNRELVVGDQVWAETLEAETLHGSYTMFSGNLIHVDF